MTITLLTGNHFKIETAQLALQSFGIKVEGHKTDLPEIQDENVLDVAKDMALREAKKINKAVVREDHGFAIEALNNVTQRYSKVGKKVHLRHLSNDCRRLLQNADALIEVNILEDPTYKVATDKI